MENKKRGTFSSGLGFVLAAAGSAVGLGNIWRFPYLAATYGGGLFLLIYILLVLTFGYSLMTAENAIGRMSGKGPLDAFKTLNKKWGIVGVISMIIPCIILPYYNVIGGWVIRFFGYYVMGESQIAADSGFGDFIASAEAVVIAQTVFTFIVGAVLLGGVQKGVERASVILMPTLIVLAVAISIYSITLPGAMEGVKYFFIPNFADFKVETVLAAMGQMFYSLSLAMGIMVAYGSYMPKNSSLEKNVGQIEIFDTVVAVLAGLMIIPAMFSNVATEAGAVMEKPGPTLMFVTLPKVFNGMPASNIIGAVFFFLVFAAALTSAISLMEAIVACICDHFKKISRTMAVILVTIGTWLVGLLPSLGFNVLSNVKPFGMDDILTFMDFITNSVLMPICALLICFFVSKGIGTKAIEAEVELSGEFKRKKLFNVMIKYVAPVLVCAVLVFSVLEGLGVVKV